jgi:hypothetical protein
MSSSINVQRVLAAARVDFKPERQPSLGSVGVATAVALGGSLGVDALLVAFGTALFPATRGFVHFRFSDYGLLTTIGVVMACGAWPLTARVTSAPRWLFLRLAVILTLALWLPDILILVRGEPLDAVAVLMFMHLAIALVTYNSLVHVAPPKVPLFTRPEAAAHPARADADDATTLAAVDTMTRPADDAVPRSVLSRHRAAWLSVLALAGLEFVLGVLALLIVPTGRPTGWVPSHGSLIYDMHAAVGTLLAVGAVLLVLASRDGERSVRVSAIIGLVGVAVGAAGGFLTVDHALRLIGMGLMLVGAMAALLGYMMPVMGPTEAPAQH